MNEATLLIRGGLSRSPFDETAEAISPFNAWVLVKRLETIRLRVEAQCDAAATLAEDLEDHHAIGTVRYPGLASHPQYEIAGRQAIAATDRLDGQSGGPEPSEVFPRRSDRITAPRVARRLGW